MRFPNLFFFAETYTESRALLLAAGTVETVNRAEAAAQLLRQLAPIVASLYGVAQSAAPAAGALAYALAGPAAGALPHALFPPVPGLSAEGVDHLARLHGAMEGAASVLTGSALAGATQRSLEAPARAAVGRLEPVSRFVWDPVSQTNTPQTWAQKVQYYRVGIRADVNGSKTSTGKWTPGEGAPDVRDLTPLRQWSDSPHTWDKSIPSDCTHVSELGKVVEALSKRAQSLCAAGLFAGDQKEAAFDDALVHLGKQPKQGQKAILASIAEGSLWAVIRDDSGRVACVCKSCSKE